MASLRPALMREVPLAVGADPENSDAAFVPLGTNRVLYFSVPAFFSSLVIIISSLSFPYFCFRSTAELFKRERFVHNEEERKYHRCR